MISYDMQEFGGLEEYAANLAIGLKGKGHDVSYVSCAWVAPRNQYIRRLKANNVSLFYPPKWLSDLSCDWNTKERLLQRLMIVLGPLVAVLGIAVAVLKHRRLSDAWKSAFNFLKGKLMDSIIGHDYRKIISPILLTWWQVFWKADIYHIQGYTNTLLFSVKWAHAKGIPVVYEEHQTPDPQFNWWKGFEHTINLADRIIAVSEKSAQGLRDVCRVTQPIVVRGPLLSDPFPSGWNKKYEHPLDQEFTITTVARLYVTKGLTYLLDAAAKVVSMYPHVRFKVYGDGPLRDELLAKAEQLGLDGEQIFPGAFTSREELTHIMNGTDIFLMSSILEGQPLAVVEAMAYGCPIVTTNVGGIPELIQDGVNGWLCPPEDPNCLAERIMMLIADADLRERLGHAARDAYVQSPFEAKSVGSFFVSVYDEVVEERKKLGLSKQVSV